MNLLYHVLRSSYSQIFFLFVLIPTLCSCSSHSNKADSLFEIMVNGKSIHVEVASTQKSRMLGLMFRNELDKDQGMLFIYPQEQYLSFWMKNTKIPLSIAFINSNGVIIQIESMTPYSLINHVSKDKLKYALEMEGDWFRENGIKVGSRISISSEVNKIKVR